ncbi:hypothetical protein B0181_03440 [Moraxella caviae]|uniref:Uncharacterized protein n=1 Tax=Moraxella caviae TaxID=34060 RepID=A0A1T0A6Z3_9GAMM|nr:hypothetical protein B0181_03440 [Moraxella caviae]
MSILRQSQTFASHIQPKPCSQSVINHQKSVTFAQNNLPSGKKHCNFSMIWRIMVRLFVYLKRKYFNIVRCCLCGIVMIA